MAREERRNGKEAEYHSRDYEWEELRRAVESDPCLSYHFSLPSPLNSSSSSPSSVCGDPEAWRRFHRIHSTGKFFKERRYLLKEFPELLNCSRNSRVFEVGCGNGSTILPILCGSPRITVYACDCSEDILLKANEILVDAMGIDVAERICLFQVDCAGSSFPSWLFCDLCRNSPDEDDLFSSVSAPQTWVGRAPAPGDDECCVKGFDFVTLIFTLSAVPFDKMPLVIKRCAAVLKPGGLILFRDYGLYDMTMLRFSSSQMVGLREYVRSDGTFSYFFSLDAAKDLFCAAGLIQLELEYCCVKSANRKNGKTMHRVWVHGKFQKPTS